LAIQPLNEADKDNDLLKKIAAPFERCRRELKANEA
jgi:hypothetical protein